MKSPLIEGFKLGIAGKEIDTAQPVTVKTIRLTIAEADQLAAKYGVHQRTVYRWLSLGVDVRDPVSIANFLLEEKQPNTNAVRNALRILKSQS